MTKLVKHKKMIDYDKWVILLIPLLLPVLLIVPDFDTLNYVFALIIAIIISLLIIYRYRAFYGFNGLRILSMPSIVFITFTTIIAIPAAYAASNGKESVQMAFFISILSFFVFFPLGLRFANLLFRIDTESVKKMYKQNFSESIYDKYVFEFLLVIFSVSFFIFCVYIIRAPQIPIVELIKNPGGYLRLNIMRELSFKLLNVTIAEKYLFAWARELFIPLGIATSFFLSLLYKKKKYILLFILFLIFGAINNSLTITKSPVAAIFLSVFSVYFIYKKILSIRFVLISLSVIILFPGLIYYFGSPESSPMRNVFNVFLMILHRIFLIPSEALYQYFLVFPDIHDFLLGRGSQFFSWMHEEGIFNVANYVAKIWWKIPLTTGNANANFIGYFWADFGYVGVFLSSYIVGIFVHILYYFTLKNSEYKLSIIYVAIVCGTTAILTFSFFSSNFTTLLLTRGLLFILLFLLYLTYKNKGSLNIRSKPESYNYQQDE